MSRFQLVLFDLDGVLVDSLPAHLQICRDKSDEYRLGLDIPDADKFRSIAHSGVRISPMRYFFMSVGFQKADAERATEDYDRNFAARYKSELFPNVSRALQALQRSDVRLGIVTSNTRRNAIAALNGCRRFFGDDTIFTTDDHGGREKQDLIAAAVEASGIASRDAVYVGDQLTDWRAARAAHVAFIGVTYGWGIGSEESDFPTVGSIAELYQLIAGEPLVPQHEQLGH